MIDKNKTLELANSYYDKFCQDAGETDMAPYKRAIKSRQVKARLFALVDAINDETKINTPVPQTLDDQYSVSEPRQKRVLFTY